MVELDDEEIDYLHPFGKLPETKEQKPTEGDSAKPDYKNYWYALQEADGHSMKKDDPFLE